MGGFAIMAAEAMADSPETDVQTVVAEQSALRRVATLVARDPTGPEVFESVTEESAKVLGAQVSSLVRFDDSTVATTVGGWSAPGYSHPPVPRRIPLDGDTAVPRVSRTGAPARLRDVEGKRGDVADMLRELGIRSALAAPIQVDGRTWGAIVLSATEPDGFSGRDEGRLCDFAELVAQAISNAEARLQLAESRARLVEASDTARRRFERNLHDGAQQWFVALSLTLRRAAELLESDPARAALMLADGRQQLDAGLRDLRELARGLHPAELTEHGLGAAIEALALRTPVPIELHLTVEERLPEVVESAVYYLTAEALTNVVRYARASSTTIRLACDGREVTVSVADDGVGGANAEKGSGLRGLGDRVEALGGRLVVDSAPGSGTRLEARLPVEGQRWILQ